jgi:hypothetical protein
MFQLHNLFFFHPPPMARGEHDKPDPTLIITGSRRAHPSKRIQGQGYPTTVLEELRERGDKGDTRYRDTVIIV